MPKPEAEKFIVEGHQAKSVFRLLGGNFARGLIQRGYEYSEVQNLIHLLGKATTLALDQAAYPDNGERFRDDEGKLFINRIPPAELRITHHLGEWGGNMLQIISGARPVIEEIEPPFTGTQGEMIVDRSQNSYCDGAVIPGGFYSSHSLDEGHLVTDSDGVDYESYGDMVDMIGQW